MIIELPINAVNQAYLFDIGGYTISQAIQLNELS